VVNPGEEAFRDQEGEAAPRRFVLAAAGAVGFVFFLMELVWYRMLAPILGGSSYTFGLILAVALAGIGIGGLLYGAGGRQRRPTMLDFAATCALEACALAVPFALGDRLAFAALVLRGLGGGGLIGLAAGWSVIAAAVVLPAAVVAGYQFPLLVGVLGSGPRSVGRDVGLAYGWNTVGAIAGSLAGGFGLLPLLSAPVAWRAAAFALVVLAALASVLGVRGGRRRRLALPLAAGVVAVLAASASGPTAAWRHGRIGAGRFAGQWNSPNALRASFESARSAILWEADGRESSVALWDDDGYALFINGKSDGNSRGDAATQVMGGLVGAMLHPAPTSALVIGLGTGSTAGWLGRVDGMQRVDVAEIEPAIRRVAEACEPVNQACLRNPRIRLQWGDARELLLTTRQRYDIIFSEPSNPYRAGISSLFTLEFYRAAAERLRPGGLYLQWVQGYEVDAEVVRTAFATLSTVFPHVEAWQLHGADLLLVGSASPIDHDIARQRARALSEPFASALNQVWGVSGVEGFYAGFVAPAELANELRAITGSRLNTDDRPRIEFGFIRSLGRSGLFSVEEVRQAARGRRPATTGGELDWALVEELRDARALVMLNPPAAFTGDEESPAGLRARARSAYSSGRPAAAAGLWMRQQELPASRADLLLLASGLAVEGADPAPRVFAALAPLAPVEARALEARWLRQRGDRAGAVEALADALHRYRIDPWQHQPTMGAALDLAVQLAAEDPAAARRMFEALGEPFSLHLLNRRRVTMRVGIAELAGDRALCRQAFTHFDERPQWDRLLFEARVRCYGGGEDPAARQAARDLADYLATEPRPLF
jgi:spermidine synthase